MLKGALHVHSTYSDGEFTLAELRRIYQDDGCAFVCMTDHAESFDPGKLLQYVDECQSLSDARFLFIAGLEFECEQRMHILGYGATERVGSKDPETVIRHIEALGALSVIAHPKNDFFDWIRKFETLPRGIETWNSKYDGRYGPRPETFALLQDLRQRKPEMLSFYGQDLHWKKQFRGLFVQLEAPHLDSAPARDGILQALARGAFTGVKGDVTLPSSGIVDPQQLAEFGKAHAASFRVWHLLKQSKQVLDRAGIRVPESVKAQLRRIF
ncbi:MAG: PHP domain-containing protein [Terriglobales bacterium]